MSVPLKRKFCNVGTGPVAWAEILCYFDRRSHKNQAKFGSGSQDLFRCGRHATDGSPRCVAPSGGSTWRLRHYINAIGKAMDSECANNDMSVGDLSWTPLPKMAGIKPFYASRQGSGRPSLEAAKTVWKTNGNDKGLRNKLTRLVRKNWPSIVGTVESNKRHYAVVTAYRSKTRKVRRCWGPRSKPRCRRWVTQQSNYQMYCHQGDGTKGNRWRSMDIHYLIAAKY